MKILIIEATQVNYLDDRGGQHADASEFVDPPKDVARKLVEVGRALYVNRTDDPSKEGSNTASKDMIAAAEAMAKAKAKPIKKPAAVVVDPGADAGTGSQTGTEPQ